MAKISPECSSILTTDDQKSPLIGQKDRENNISISSVAGKRLKNVYIFIFMCSSVFLSQRDPSRETKIKLSSDFF